MTDATDSGDLRCDRIRLLLSLQLDGAATAPQEQEIAGHVEACADCRAARDIDLAVRRRLGTEAVVPQGFSTRVAALARASEARAQNRLLLIGAAAAALIAAVIVIGHDPSTSSHGGGDALVAASDTRSRAVTAVTAGSLASRTAYIRPGDR